MADPDLLRQSEVLATMCCTLQHSVLAPSVELYNALVTAATRLRPLQSRRSCDHFFTAMGLVRQPASCAGDNTSHISSARLFLRACQLVIVTADITGIRYVLKSNAETPIGRDGRFYWHLVGNSFSNLRGTVCQNTIQFSNVIAKVIRNSAIADKPSGALGMAHP